MSQQGPKQNGGEQRNGDSDDKPEVVEKVHHQI